MRMIAAAFLSVCLALHPGHAVADPQRGEAVLVPLERGEPAPFSGVLMSPRAAAETIAAAEAAEREKSSAVAAAVDGLQVRCDLDLERSRLQARAAAEVAAAAVAARDAEIASLIADRPDRATWAALGAGAGAIAAFALVSLLR